MVAAPQDTHDLVAEALGDLPPDDRALIREVWMRLNEGNAEYWVHAEPPSGVPEIPEERELNLYALEDALYARQPEPYPMVFIIHAARYENDSVTGFVFEPPVGTRRVYPTDATR